MKQSIVILFEDSRGIYIPKEFAESFEIGREKGKWNGIGGDDGHNQVLADLREGPEGDNYWDAWQYVLDNAEYIDSEGNVYRLYQDGDLFAVCEELMTAEEKQNLFGDIE